MVEVELDACAYAFAPGQRLRLSVAGADWPNTVAPPAPHTLTVHGGELELPVWSGTSPHTDPVFDAGDELSSEDAAGTVWRVERDVLARTTSCVVDHGSTYEVPYDGEATEHYRGRVEVDTRGFGQRAVAEAHYRLSWPGTEVSTRAMLDLAVAPDAYDVDIRLEARAGDEVVGERRWHERLPR